MLGNFALAEGALEGDFCIRYTVSEMPILAESSLNKGALE
jgi:hypothetical protein